jgi:hypothetical protein
MHLGPASVLEGLAGEGFQPLRVWSSDDDFAQLAGLARIREWQFRCRLAIRMRVPRGVQLVALC